MLYVAHKRQARPAELYYLNLGNRGRLVLPAQVRRRLGIRDGHRLMLTIESDGSLRLVSLHEQIRKLEGVFAHLARGLSLVDELLRERRDALPQR